MIKDKALSSGAPITAFLPHLKEIRILEELDNSEGI
jgi:hypothetical protein